MAVYISHSRQNSSAALKLCEALERRQVKTWLDLRELDSGADWNEKVTQAIHNADAFVFLIGPPGPPDHVQQFDWQRVVEEEIYMDSNKPLIPVVIGAAEIPGFLSIRKVIAVDTTSMDFEAIASAIVGYIAKPGDSVDVEKLEQGRQARDQALKKFRDYSRELEEEDIKRSALRGFSNAGIQVTRGFK
jgi:hypothetical protein